MGVGLAPLRGWPQRLEWRAATTWLPELIRSGAVCLPCFPINDDNHALVRLGRLLGPPSLRAQAYRSGLVEGRGVQAVQARPGGAINRFGQPLRSAGYEAFALHTDEAFLPVPCRWVLLLCCQSDPDGEGVTLLADFRALNDASMEAAMNVPLPYPDGGRPVSEPGPRWRFNRDALALPMLTAVQGAAVETVAHGLSLHRVSGLLEQGDLLIIDNWRVAHGRHGFSADSPRRLKRLRLLGD